MKNLKIEIPNGYEIDKEKSTFENIVFKEVNKLPASWDNKFANLYNAVDIERYSAFKRLMILVKIYNDGWIPDWNDGITKYSIHFINNTITTDSTYGLSRPLTFKTKELRDLFLENFEDLILTAKPLL